ncbi:unnamed protein product [Closterium sp. Naga37s-1]|nr:unnamed protein product [Closterium sp. Naga37s-1]
MPRQSKKGAQQAAKAGNVERDHAAKGHQSEPATPKPMLKEVEGPFADDVRISLVKKLTALKFPPTASSAGGGEDSAAEEKDEATEVTPPAVDPVAPVVGEEEEEEEDDGYLSDDPEERFDPVKAGEIAARAGFSITLLVPIKYEEEVPRTIDTVKGLLALWRRSISAHVLDEVPGPVAGVAVEKAMLDEKKIFLDWQHPENPTYTHKRATNPDSIEVLLKSVLAAITPEMVYEYLVKTVLEKRSRTPFLSGAAFHRVVDPRTGADTDKIRGLVKGHPGDKYRWILRDPAVVLVSTGGSREDWLCVKEACDKAHGSSFSQAMAHVKSVQHCTALLQGDAASRKSKGMMNFIPVRKEFGLQH